MASTGVDTGVAMHDVDLENRGPPAYDEKLTSEADAELLGTQKLKSYMSDIRVNNQ